MEWFGKEFNRIYSVKRLPRYVSADNYVGIIEDLPRWWMIYGVGGRRSVEWWLKSEAV